MISIRTNISPNPPKVHAPGSKPSKKPLQNFRRYQTKPQEVEVIQFTRENWDDIVKFINGCTGELTIPSSPFAHAHCIIYAQGNNLLMTEGEYIVKNSNGTLTRHTEREFLELYEPIP